MSRTVKSARGVISIFVALMMTGILSLGTFVLEAARLQTARTQLGEAANSAASSMLSTYDGDLKARYGILAMDTQRANEAACSEYVQFNSDLSNGAYGNNVTRLYQVTDVDMTGVYNLTYPHLLKRQLIAIAKFGLPAETSEFNVHTAPYVLPKLQEKCNYVSDMMVQIQNLTYGGTIEDLDPQLVNALTALDKTFGASKKFDEKHAVILSQSSVSKLPSTTGTVESEIPETDLQNIDALHSDAFGYLGANASVLGTESAASVQQMDVSINMVALNEVSSYHDPSWLGGLTQDDVVQIIYTGGLPGQYKDMADSVNAAINILQSDMTGNVLLNSYISQTFSNRRYVANQYIGPGLECDDTGSEEITFAKACCEYVFGGSASEVKNQQTAYDYIMAIRLIGNLYDVFVQENTLDLTNSYSVAAHMAWAYYETCLDMHLLTQYDAAVPLNKERPVLRMEDAESIATLFEEGDAEKALRAMGYYNESTGTFVINGRNRFNYTDSLNLALWMVPNTQKLLRTADLMQLEMRYKQRYVDGVPATFLMSEQNTFCRVECSARLNSILPVLSIGGAEHNIQGLPLSTLKYAGY